MAKKEVKMTKNKTVKALSVKKITPKKIAVKNSSVESFSQKAQLIRTSPKDVFLHLLMLVMLYLGVISLISLIFVYVNYSFPDTLGYYSGSGLLNNIRWQSSMLIVSFPLLLILSYFVQRDFRNNPEKHGLRFYKWLTYLTLFVTAITMVVDLILLVNSFYGGELTTSFVLKVISVLVISGAVFGYYIWDVHTESYKSKIPNVVGWISSVLVVGILVLGFFLAGSPSHQREVRMDEIRVNDLGSIQNELIYFWQNKRELPPSLTVLENDFTGYRLPVDPETNLSYEYKILEPLKFELCTTFNVENKMSQDSSYSYYPPTSDNWDHSEGRTCYERTIDPELYPELTTTIDE